MSLLFNGKDVYHPFVTLIGTYLILQYIKNPTHITIASWVFNFSYLLISYYLYSSTEYDLNWLTPQSIICLRLIGLSMDYADGLKKSDGKSAPKSRTVYAGLTPPTQWAIAEKPELIEMFGYCYFYGSSIVGPQFSFRRYRKFISLELFETKDTSLDKDLDKLLDSSFKHSILHLLKGVLYNGVFLVVSHYFNSLFLLTKEFTQLSPIRKFIYVWVTGKFVLFKYLGVWMLVESQCIINMLQFDGLNPKTKDYYWNAINNVDGKKFNTAFNFGDLVASYNIKTNLWSKHYVYKRFAFLGNKHYSSLINLTFLSIWHGFHIGYPLSFYFEYFSFIIQGINQYWFRPLNEYMSRNLETNKTISFKIQYTIYHIVCTALTFAGTAYPLLAFDLLTWDKIKVAYNNVYWIGHIITAAIIGANFIALKIKGSHKKAKKIQTNEKVENDKKNE